MGLPRKLEAMVRRLILFKQEVKSMPIIMESMYLMMGKVQH